jgi:hypothetical protein
MYIMEPYTTTTVANTYTGTWKFPKWGISKSGFQYYVMVMTTGWFGSALCFGHLHIVWVKPCHFYHPWLGMVNIPPIKMVIFLGDGANDIVLPILSRFTQSSGRLHLRHFLLQVSSEACVFCWSHLKPWDGSATEIWTVGTSLSI